MEVYNMLSNLNIKIKKASVIGIFVLAIMLFYGSVAFGEEPKELVVGGADWSQKYPASYHNAQALRDKVEEINEQGKYKIKLIQTDAGGKREKFLADLEDLLVQQVDILILAAQSPNDYPGWKNLVEKQLTHCMGVRKIIFLKKFRNYYEYRRKNFMGNIKEFSRCFRFIQDQSIN